MVYVWQPLWAIRLLARMAPGCVWFVPTDAPLVGLSFDDGPHPTRTPAVLDLLRAHGAHATFFLIGENAQRHPDLVARIRAEGHEVGNHDLTDGTALFRSESEFAERLRRTEELIGPPRPVLYRPAGGLCRPAQRAIASAAGYTCVLGSAFPYDPARPPVRYMQWLVAKNLGPGAIVILHDGGDNRDTMLAALPGILDTLDARGLRGVTISQLIAAGPPLRGNPR